MQTSTRTPRNIPWRGMIPFILIHLRRARRVLERRDDGAVVCGIALYLVRMFAVTGGYHRYFSHRTYKTSRVFQFILAFLAQSTAQKGALWWAAHHRAHHRFSDKAGDLHSPVNDGFWYSHVGWLFNGTGETDYTMIPDFARFPELRFLNKHYLLPPIVMGVVVWLTLGWSGSVHRLLCQHRGTVARHVHDQLACRTCSAIAVSRRRTTAATTGSSRSSRSVRGGTTTTTASPRRLVRGSTGGNTTSRSTF